MMRSVAFVNFVNVFNAITSITCDHEVNNKHKDKQYTRIEINIFYDFIITLNEFNSFTFKFKIYHIGNCLFIVV